MSETRHIDAASVPVVLGAGLTALDTVVSSERRRVVRCFLGGTCGNVLSILSALSWQCYPIGRLDPADPAISYLADELACWGVRRDLLHLAPTARVPIVAQRNKASPGGGFQHAFSFRCPRCRRHLPGYAAVRIDSATQILKDLPAAQVFFFDRPAPGNLVLAKEAAARGALLVFEPSSIGKGPAVRHFREALTLAHVLKYSHSRLPGLADDPGFPRAPLLEIETRGETGLRYRRALPGGGASDWVMLPAFPAVVSGDTAGAGDWTTAVALHLLQLGGHCQPNTLQALLTVDLEATLRAAQAAAAWNCQFEGARGGMYQQRSLLSDFVERLMGRRYPLQLRANGPLPSPNPIPLEVAMRKVCPVCRGFQPAPPAPGSAPAAPLHGPWKTVVDQPGYVGRRQQTAAQELDRRYGSGRWRIAYAWHGETITREQALDHYTAAYEAWLKKNPELLDWLVRTASDVYDLSPEDVRSGTDYNIQTGPAVHLQDIAVRLAVQRLGRQFEGTRLIQIRGKQAEGACLSPGVVPFHEPEAIRKPELNGWWEPGTVESFWQSNKVLQVRQPPSRTLLFGGSFNPIHNGHLALARFAREQLGFDRVLFIPNGDHYHKADLAPALARLAMVRAAIEGEAAYEAVDVEVHSRESLRVVQTTEELREQYPEDELVLLRGLDALHKTHHKLFRIPGLRVLVVHRDTGKRGFDKVLSRHPHLEANRSRLEYLGEAVQFPLSSTEVRCAVREGRSIEALVPPGVAAIIQTQGLYR